MINIALRNGMIMHKAYYIRYVLSRYGHGKDDDKFHDAVLYIAQHLERFDSTKGNLNGWLWRQVRGSLSKSSYRTCRECAVESYDSVARNLRNPRNVLSAREYMSVRREAINKALSNIGLREQWLIKEYYFKKRTMVSIAEDEGMSAQGVRYRIQRILKRMRRDVEHYAVDLGR